MNYLQLCQRVHKLAQVQGRFSSVTDTGINGEIAQLVSDCWVDLQKFRKDWLFMWLELQFTMIADPSQSSYTRAELFTVPGSDNLGMWKVIAAQTSCYITDPDDNRKSKVVYVPYEIFRDATKNTSTTGKPKYWTYKPGTLELKFNALPDKAYTVEIDYYRTPQRLGETDSPNTEVPHIDQKWHDLIAYKAVSDFAMAKSMSGLYGKYEGKYAIEIGELMREQVPARNVVIREVA